jgi:hypothetical protein
MKWWMLQRFKINCCVYMLFPPHNTLGDWITGSYWMFAPNPVLSQGW